jgi:HEAT repeat protein
VPALGKALRDQYPEVRKQAGQALAQVGQPSMPELIRALRERDVRFRQRAAKSLALIGPEAREAVPDLIVCLRDPDTGVRAATVLALGEIGPEARSAVPRLVGALGDPNDTVRALALEALRAIGPGATEALGQTLLKGQPRQRQAAAQALGLLGRPGRKALPQLRQALRDRDARVRAAAGQALGRMGTEAKEAADDLLKALHDRDLRTQVNAAVTLVLLAPSVPGLLDKIRAEDRKGRWSLPRGLARQGAVRAEEVARLEKLLDDKDLQKRLGAVLALARLARRSPAAVKALTGALRHDDLQVRLAAAEVLADGGPEVRRVRVEAEQALQAIQEANRARRRQLVHRAMSDPEVQARLNGFLGLLIAYKASTSGECRGSVPVAGPMRITPGLTGRRPVPLPAQRGGLADAMTAFDRALDATLANLGPEAIPALVRAVNHLLQNPTGFC